VARPALASSTKRILLVSAGAGLLALAGALAQPDQYRSAALLLPDSLDKSSLLAAVGVSRVGLEFGAEDLYYPDILESRWMLEAMAREPVRFSYRPWKFAAATEYSGPLLGFLDPDGAAGYDAALAHLGSWISARRSLKTGTLTVEVRAPSPDLAYLLNRLLIQKLEQALKEKITTQSKAKADYTGTRVEWARREEAAARGRFVAFSRDHVNYAQSPDAQVRTQGESLYGDLQLKRDVLSSLTLANVQAEVAAHSTLPLVSVLDDGYRATRKSGPPRLLIAVAAALGGGLATWCLSRLSATLREAGRGQAG